MDVSVYDVSGRRVAAIVKGAFPAGWRREAWDLRDGSGHRVAPGIYLIRASTGGLTAVRKLVVID